MRSGHLPSWVVVEVAGGARSGDEGWRDGILREEASVLNRGARMSEEEARQT